MIGLLVRGFIARAEEIARWETGAAPEITNVSLASDRRGQATMGDETVEFRITTNGIRGRTVYVVTVSEVTGR